MALNNGLEGLEFAHSKTSNYVVVHIVKDKNIHFSVRVASMWDSSSREWPRA